MVVDSVGRKQVSLVRSSWKRLRVLVTLSVERRVCVCVLVRTVLDATRDTAAASQTRSPQKRLVMDFPGSPVVKTLAFRRRGRGFNP